MDLIYIYYRSTRGLQVTEMIHSRSVSLFYYQVDLLNPSLSLLFTDRSKVQSRADKQTVKQNQIEYGLPLKILSYNELYGWTMDKIVSQVGKKNNCTFCGVFLRQALDRGAAQLGVDHIVTGHNADDIAETVLMNSESSTRIPISQSCSHLLFFDICCEPEQ
jgi:tRNA(Ile)-lysidine synthase TilS/MesJ